MTVGYSTHRRPGWARWLGALSIAAGCVGFLFFIFHGVTSPNRRLVVKSYAEYDMLFYWSVLGTLLRLAACVMLLAGGALLLKARREVRFAAVGAFIASGLFALGEAVTTSTISENMLLLGYTPKSILLFRIRQGVLIFLQLAFPAFLLIWICRKSIRTQIKDWPRPTPQAETAAEARPAVHPESQP